MPALQLPMDIHLQRAMDTQGQVSIRRPDLFVSMHSASVPQPVATLHVRNVSDDLYELLRERAAANDRSIAAEAIQLLHERLSSAAPAALGVTASGRRRTGSAPPITRFTAEARQVVVAAQERARDLGHDRIATEHLLLGVFDLDARSPLRRALRDAGLTTDRVRAEIERDPGRGAAAATGKIPFEAGAKQALELAFREALKLGQTPVAPDHILLGILDSATGRGAEILRTAKGGEDDLRTRLGSLRRILVPPAPHAPRFAPRASFRVLALEGDAESWESQLNEAASLGYDLVEIVDRRAILRRT